MEGTSDASMRPSRRGDEVRTLAPSAIIATQPNAIVVSATVPAQNLAELLSWAKTAKPGFATPGSGTTPHLTAEHLFRSIAGLDMTPIHFKGAGPAITAVIGAQPPVGSAAISTALQHIQSGKLRALAGSSATPIAAPPHLPTPPGAGLAGI